MMKKIVIKFYDLEINNLLVVDGNFSQIDFCYLKSLERKFLEREILRYTFYQAIHVTDPKNGENCSILYYFLSKFKFIQYNMINEVENGDRFIEKCENFEPKILKLLSDHHSGGLE